MKKLIIAEKPSVARDIVKVLKDNFKQSQGYWEGDQYIVSHAVGHLVTLKEPEDYDIKLKKWLFDDLPIVPELFELKAVPQTKAQYEILRGLIKRVDCIVNACDAGREGELIFSNIVSLAGYKGKVERLWISSLTDEAIKEGFANLKDGQEYNNLLMAAKCRSIGDWLIGINATRAYTVRNNTLLSIGRVQTPTLAILAQREREIMEFKPEDYWTITTDFLKGEEVYQGKWIKDKNEKIPSEAEAKVIKEKLKGKHGLVDSVETKEKRDNPPLPYDLTTLQRDANKKYGYTAAQTLSLAQKLYEEHKLITYPRTDSRYVTEDLVKTFGRRLAAVNIDPYQGFLQEIKVKNYKVNRAIVNAAKVTDHHAIIPTEKQCRKQLTKGEQDIYDLVVRGFLMQYYPAHRYSETKIVTLAEGEQFNTTGKMILEDGWRVLEVKSEKKAKKKEAGEPTLPLLHKGDEVGIGKIEVKAQKTKAPQRYTENTLLSAMENGGKEIEEEELKAVLKDVGLGTPATRAGIIERLKKVGYLTTKGKSLAVSEKGLELVEKISTDSLTKPELTGQWEKRLREIEQGQESPGRFYTDIRKLTFEIIHQCKQSKTINMPVDERLKKKSLGKCPFCDGVVLENAKAFGCSNWSKHPKCEFTLWKTMAGKTMNIDHVKALMEKGRTEVIKGFKSKSGKEFDAAVKLQGKKVVFEFVEDKATVEN